MTGRYFLLKRHQNGWMIVQWWRAWAESIDSAGEVRLYGEGVDGRVREVPAAEAAARLTR